MKQILQNLRNGETSVVEVPAPGIAPGMVQIQTRRSLISVGTERMLIEFAQASLLGKAKAQPEKVRQALDKIRADGLLPTLEAIFSRLDEPLPLGYCNAGVVLDVGSGVTEFRQGDRVVSNGPHAEIVVVPRNLCCRIPDEVSDEQACFTVLASIGLQGMRLVNPGFGETVAVLGLGLIGLVTAELLLANGCRVIGTDLNQERLNLAAAWGCETIKVGGDTNPVAATQALTEGKGVDAVIITASSGSDEIVHQAAEMCRKRGKIVLVGVTGLNLRRADFYAKELTFQVSCSYGPGRYDSSYEEKGHDYPYGYVRWTEQRNFAAVLGAIRNGALRIDDLISDRVALVDAPLVYARLAGDSSVLGVVLEYSEDTVPARTVAMSATISRPGSCVAALIGAGNFAKMTMVPALCKTMARRKYVCTRKDSASAAYVARKFGFEQATTDGDAVWRDSEVNVVFIATGHDSHAALVCQALAAGKHVFVEKPLALTRAELGMVRRAAEAHPNQHLMVGFNRRFSPHVKRIKDLLTGRGEPLGMSMTINAGIIPAESWVHDPGRGGGRIIGEGCHFIDLLAFLAGSPVQTVAALQMESGVTVKQDKMAIILGFEDGSVGTINYFANGSKSYAKERLEIFSDGRVLCMSNFRETRGFGFRGFRKFKTFRQDKGHAAQFMEFVNRIESGGGPLIPLNELVNSALASFAAVTAASEKRMISLSDA